MRNSTALLSILVAVLAVSSGVLFHRQQGLADRLSELEARQTSRAAAPAATGEPSTASTPTVRETAPRAPVEMETRRAPTSPAPSATATATAPADLSPALQAAVAKEVDRAMKERGNVVFETHPAEDPLALLEKELGLSPAQKLRIQDYWKRRDDAVAKLPGEGLLKNPGEHLKKMTEIEQDCEAAVKRELDFSQQEKYDALKREGKLWPGGAVFRLDVLKSDK